MSNLPKQEEKGIVNSLTVVYDVMQETLFPDQDQAQGN